MNKELLKQLRQLTKAPMKDCSDALSEANDDMDKALEIIKIKGKNIVSGRENAPVCEGIISIISKPKRAVMVECNCQTDFVALNQDFVAFAQQAAQELESASENSQPFDSSSVSLENTRHRLIASTKENILIRRWWVEEALSPNTRVFSYQHFNNKIGVLLTLSGPQENLNHPEFLALGDDLVSQIAAMNPLSISIDRLDPSIIDKQKSVFEAQLSEKSLSPDVLNKILIGKMSGWYSETVLLHQELVTQKKQTVQQAIDNLSKKLNGEIQVVNFIRVQAGEHLEKKVSNLQNDVSEVISKL